jgi:integrase
MSKQKRRKHPGVTLLKPEPERRIGWRGRYRDPDSGKVVKPSLDAALRTAEMRIDWAVRKSKAIAKRRLELEAGAHRETGTGLAGALDQYFKDHPQLRDGTRGIYRRAADKLAAWGAQAGVRSADELTGPKVVAFRASLVREPLRSPAKGGTRGELKAKAEARAPQTVNSELRAIRTVLGYLRKLGLLPHVNSDDLKDGLERLAVSHERTHYLKSNELQRLLDAAVKHDAEVFAATREEHAGKRDPGSTQRYEPIAPLIACALLTGMRAGEVLDLNWDQVELDALDNDGKVVGEIHLTGATKTKRTRTIGLEVSPALRLLLEAMQKRKGTGSVFGITRDTAKAAAKRLKAEYGALSGFGWQALRRTCGTYLTNSPGIFGAASAYRSAKQLGHSVQVAERHYLDVARGISRDARTLEAAMQIEEQLDRVIAAVRKPEPITLDVTRKAR